MYTKIVYMVTFYMRFISFYYENHFYFIGLYTYYFPTCFGETEKIANRNSAGLVPVGQMGTNFCDQNSKEIRSTLTDYFAAEGSVPFQYDNT